MFSNRLKNSTFTKIGGLQLKHYNKVSEIIQWIIFNWIFATALIIFGYWRLRKIIKETSWDDHYLTYDIFIKGFAFSIGCIIMGVIILYIGITEKQ
jgi:hypothetical protein